jgi:transcriptional regulator of acetoin/glycerol metabolism
MLRGRFRSDLLFRLNTLEVTLPPLGRRSDFDAIARHLLASIDPARSLSPCALDYLSKCDWPGNIRELRNVLARLTLQDGSAIIEGTMAQSVLQRPVPAKRKSTLHEQHVAQVLTTYGATGHNISETARRLGVSRNTVYRALEQER